MSEELTILKRLLADREELITKMHLEIHENSPTKIDYKVDQYTDLYFVQKHVSVRYNSIKYNIIFYYQINLSIYKYLKQFNQILETK